MPLARKVGRSKSWVTQLLDGGESNKTIRTVADVLAVLGQEVRITCWPISIGGESQVLRLDPMSAGGWLFPQNTREEREEDKWTLSMPQPQIKTFRTA